MYDIIEGRERIVDFLRAHPEGQVLFIGGRDTNFPGEIRTHRRCVFWDSTDPKTKQYRKVPKAVVMIVFTRFITHAISSQLRKSITSRGEDNFMVVDAKGSTGLVCEVIKEGLGLTADDEHDNSQTLPTAGEFVLEHWDPNAKDAPKEIFRLAGLAKKKWPPGDSKTINLAGIAGAFYKLRRDQEENPEPTRASEILHDVRSFMEAGAFEVVPIVRGELDTEMASLAGYVNRLLRDRKQLSQKVQELVDEAKANEDSVIEALERGRLADELISSLGRLHEEMGRALKR